MRRSQHDHLPNIPRPVRRRAVGAVGHRAQGYVVAEVTPADAAKLAAFTDMRDALRRHLIAMDRLSAVGSPNVSDWQYITSKSASDLRTVLERVSAL